MSHAQRTWQVGANPAVTWLNKIEKDLATVAATYHVRDYADGVGAGSAAVDTAALQAAAADAVANRGIVGIGGIPELLLSANVTIGKGASIQGQGGAYTLPSTKIKCTAAGAGLTFDGGEGGISSGFMVDGNDVATLPIAIEGIVDRVFMGITVIKSAGVGWRFRLVQNSLFLGCKSYFNALDGLRLEWGAGGNLFSGGESANNGSGGGYNLHIREIAGSTSGYTEPTQNCFHHYIFEYIPAGQLGQVMHAAGSNNVFDDVIIVGGYTSPTTLLSMPTSALGANAGLVLRDVGFIGGKPNDTALAVGSGCYVLLRGGTSFTGVETAIDQASGAAIDLDLPDRAFNNVTTKLGGAGAGGDNAGKNFAAPILFQRAAGKSLLRAFVDGDAGERYWMYSDGKQAWGPGTGFSPDVEISRSAADVLGLGVGDGLEFGEAAADLAAPAANKVRIYSRDNGAGKTQIVARFPTGAVQVIATEP